jgi:hypothetical protein
MVSSYWRCATRIPFLEVRNDTRQQLTEYGAGDYWLSAREVLPRQQTASGITNGILVTQFEPGVIISSGSVQAVSPTHIEQAGLDVSRRHIEWFVSLDVLGVERDASGDEIEWDSKRWKVITPEKWVVQDGWCAVICQEV